MPTDFKQKDIKTTTQAERVERESEADVTEQAGRRGGGGGGKGKSTAQDKDKEGKGKGKDKDRTREEEGFSLSRNLGHPVVIGNAVLVGLLGGVLGLGGYRRFLDGRLSWRVAGAWSGVVAAYGVVDYLVSR